MQCPKDLISEYEYYSNGFHRLSGQDVKVVNVRVRKDKYIADVIHVECETGRSQRYNGCEYPRELLDKVEPDKT